MVTTGKSHQGHSEATAGLSGITKVVNTLRPRDFLHPWACAGAFVLEVCVCVRVQVVGGQWDELQVSWEFHRCFAYAV